MKIHGVFFKDAINYKLDQFVGIHGGCREIYPSHWIQGVQGSLMSCGVFFEMKVAAETPGSGQAANHCNLCC